MKFTALEEYGLRCILRLTSHELAARDAAARAGGPQGEGPQPSLTLGDIAQAEGLTEQYAGKIIRVLIKHGYIDSARGRNGGYRLARPPEQILVGEILDALGGRLFDGEVCGRYTGDRHVCVRSTDCAIRSLWRELQSMVDRVLTRTTLADLLQSEHTTGLRMREHAAEPTPKNPGILPTVLSGTARRKA
jgi:Rrf2 family protein